MTINKSIFLLLLLLTQVGMAQVGKYLVLFKDKNNNTHSITNPLTFVNQRSIDRRAAQGIPFTIDDLPPTKDYVDGLKAAGATVWYTSRWANAALVLMTPSVATNVLALPYVKGFESGGPMDNNSIGVPSGRKKVKFEDEFIENIAFGNSTTQNRMLGVQHLHNAAFKGEGKIIAVLDDGFNRINSDLYLASLFTENRVVDRYDFDRNQIEVYDIGGHGNVVLSTMAANIPGTFVGTAPQAKYALFRTEVAATERIVEEAYYLLGCERADSLGADLINSSLGYSTYDYAPYNHTNADYTGDKTLVTRAADWAARAGILVCTSAGNSGASSAPPIPNIAAPADADSVMAIGAVGASEIKTSFSSEGPTADIPNRLKPDMAAMGAGVTVSWHNGTNTLLGTSSGTSFSSPIFAGFAACFWQANPGLNNMQVIAALKAMGSQASIPDNNLGWGIPKYPDLTIAIDQDQRTKPIQPGIQNSFLTTSNNRILAQIFPNGANPITGDVTLKVNIVGTTPIVNTMPAVQRFFEITPSINPQMASGKVTLFVKQAEFDFFNVNNRAYLDLMASSVDNTAKPNLRIIKKSLLPDNSIVYTAIDPLDTDIIWNSIENFWEIAFDNQGFSEFYISSIEAVSLPIELLSFEAKKNSTGNMLKWETANEYKFDYFLLQKSIDTSPFETIVRLAGKNTKENNTYTFFEPLNHQSQTLYYRLKMVDLDGKYSLSNIITIDNYETDKVTIKENPVTERLNIAVQNTLIEEVSLQIVSLAGIVVYNQNLKPIGNQLTVNLLGLSRGEYIIKISAKNFEYSKKIIKL